MKRILALALTVVLSCVIASAWAAPKPKKPALEAKPVAVTQEVALGLADKYIKSCTPKLDFDTKQTVEEIKTKLFMSKGLKSEQDKTVDELVNQLTMALAGQKKFDAITVSSAILLQTRPASARAANLFASALHTSNKLDDAVKMFVYTLSLNPKSHLAMLNLANAYLDVKEWEKAKVLADKVVFEDRECQAAHKVLAYYWYNKKNVGRFREELLKAAKFKGFVRKKTEKKNKRTEEHEGEAGDATGALEQKCKALEEEVPLTTADIIEEEFPAEAGEIREKYGKLSGDEQFFLPKLPQCNTNGPKDFETSEPIIEEWMKVFGARAKRVAMLEAAEMGIDPNASEKVIEAQAKAAAKKQMEEGMQQAQDAMKWLKNANLKGMTGANKAELNKAMKKLQQVSKQEGINIKDNPVNLESPPTFDSGSGLVITNYIDYMRISRTYEFYFMKYFQEFNAKTADIYKVYGRRIKEENDAHEERMKPLSKQHAQEGNPHGEADGPCRAEELRHKKILNAIGADYYHQWSGLYMPQYAQKMKPTIDAYYKVCMVYVKNMNDPKIMKREYAKVRRMHMHYAVMAGTLIGGGGAFEYYGETDEEERQLEADIARAKEEAEQKKPQFEREFKEPDFDLSKWLEDHLVLEVSGEFLSLKITPKNIEFEAWAFGPGAGVKVDWTEETLETYVGAGAKLKVGVNVCGAKVGVEAKGDFVRKTAKWDFAKGTYQESYGAVGEVKADAGFAAASGTISVNTQLEAKVGGKITVQGADGTVAGGVQGEMDL